MARNRRRVPGARLRRLLWPVRVVAALLGALRGPALAAGAVVAVAALGHLGWDSVQRSPYFQVRTLEVEATPNVDRDAVLEITGLDRPVNVLRFDARAAELALLAHPWVSTAEVEKRLPDAMSVRVRERRPAGVVSLGALYLVDAEGQPFVRASPSATAGLPLVTGVSREAYETSPALVEGHVREALALARLYAGSPLAGRRPLGSVHVAGGGRLELMLGRTRVALGRGNHREKLERLGRIVEALEGRRVDAAYILLDEAGERAVVKEVPVSAKPLTGANG